MIENVIIRPATLNDCDFLVEAIVEAEKSGTDKLGLATLFGLTEREVRNYLVQILEEEIDGCELSVHSFLIAELDRRPVAAIAGWIEGDNEEKMTSALLKANLLSYVFPPSSFIHIHMLSEIIRDIHVEREIGAYQIEYVYVIPDCRGRGLVRQLLQAHIEKGYREYNILRKIQVQVFANNPAAIRAYEKMGFKIIKEYRGNQGFILNYLPDYIKLMLEKTLR